MKAVTAEQMRELDRRTIAAGTPAETLMERAGFAVAKQVGQVLQHHRDRPVLIFAGKGNNGGDAVVAARHLAAAGCPVTLVTVEPRRESPMGVRLVRWSDTVTAELPAKAVIVDGLLGTGLTGEVREPYASAIAWINRQPGPVVAIDVPSGLGSGRCVRADLTVTIGLPKIELLKHLDVVGRLEVADIGLVRDVASDVELITRDDFTLPARRRTTHKGECGHLLILAGSPEYTGAPVLCAHAAARSATGLVTLAVPPAAYPVIAAKCPPEIMVRSWENRPAADAIAIGPGLGQGTDAGNLVRDVLANARVPVVLDADALNLLARQPARLQHVTAPVVVTPHPGEMGRLRGQTAAEVQAARWDVARQFVAEYPVTLVLKGAGTVVTERNAPLWINVTGNPGMAKGGMGDVLTGIIGALLAQGMPALEAAKAGVFLHGTAGDVAARQHGERAMLASDLIEALGAAFASV